MHCSLKPGVEANHSTAKSKDLSYFHTSSSPVEANNSKSMNHSTVKTKDSGIGQYKMQTADRVQNADCTPGTKYNIRLTSYIVKQ